MIEERQRYIMHREHNKRFILQHRQDLLVARQRLLRQVLPSLDHKLSEDQVLHLIQGGLVDEHAFSYFLGISCLGFTWTTPYIHVVLV